MQLYAITDRKALAEDESDRGEKLVKLAAVWARGGVDYIQIREKDLPPAELETLVRRVSDAVKATPPPPGSATTPVLVNGRGSIVAMVARAAGADGVHLPGGFTQESISASIAEARHHFAPKTGIVSVACHSPSDVEWAREEGADLVLFAPVFGKVMGVSYLPGVGLQSLAAACEVAGAMPLFALGGVTAGNARVCAAARAAGVAGIRLFLDRGWETLRDRSRSSIARPD